MAESIGRLEDPLTGRGVELSRGMRTAYLGRDEHCDLVVDDAVVSGRHASVGWRDGAVIVRDEGSKNGTFVDGRRLGVGGLRLRGDSELLLGTYGLRVVGLDGGRPASSGARSLGRFIVDRDLLIGRDPSCDIVLDEAAVSRRHARVRAGEAPTVEDLSSRGGVRVDGSLRKVARLAEGEVVGISHFELRFEGGALAVTDRSSGESLRADRVGVRIGDGTILEPVSLGVAPGEMVALIGPSGSGKTTLLKVLVGELRPSEGAASLGAAPVAARGRDLGYVPQSETIHDRLSVDEVLRYAARLRLPDDTSGAELEASVERALGELDLGKHRRTWAMNLSGGQRKRLSCGIELIGNPAFLLLDEPTSGLDPALEHSFMALLRSVADAGRGVLVTTHATSSIGLCDVLVVMASGGHLAFVGAPEDALLHFEVESYDEIYRRLPEIQPPGISSRSPRTRPESQAAVAASPRSAASQFTLLTGRYARTFWRDRRTLLALLTQVPVIALLITLIFPAHLLALPDEEPGKSAQFVFLLVTVAIWLGLISATREIVKERAILDRELAVGLRVSAYLGSKCVVLGVLTLAQVSLLLAMVFVLQPLSGGGGAEYVRVWLLLVGCSWAAATMGLAVSAVARSADQATSIVPLLLIPQLLFAGAVVPYQAMQFVARAISLLVVARWGFASVGDSIDLNDRLGGSRTDLATFGDDFFTIDAAAAVPVIAVFVLTGLLIAAGVLSRAAPARR